MKFDIKARDVSKKKKKKKKKKKIKVQRGFDFYGRINFLL